MMALSLNLLAIGRWADTLTDVENRAYEARAVEELGEQCARWLRGPH